MVGKHIPDGGSNPLNLFRPKIINPSLPKGMGSPFLLIWFRNTYPKITKLLTVGFHLCGCLQRDMSELEGSSTASADLSGILEKPLNDLPTYLREKTTELTTLTALFARYSDVSAVADEDRTILNDITSGLGSIQKVVTTLQREKHRLLHELECDKVSVARLRVIRDKLKEQEENLPPHMPRTANSAPAAGGEEPHTEDNKSTRKRGNHNVQFVEPDEGDEEKVENVMPPPKRVLKRCDPSKLPTKAKKTKIVRITKVPAINYLTIDEYKSLPKYMLGRVKYEVINSLIDEINSCATQKYKIVDTPLNKLSSENMKKLNRMTDSVETKDTLDKVWFESQDLKDFASSAQVAHNFIKLLPILRHCQRLRQFRAGKIEKYVII